MTSDIRNYISIIETGSVPPLKIFDDVGGYIKIDPNPEIVKNSTRISITYINTNIASYYGIDPRILAYDSHGHRGLSSFDPHFHLFQKNKSNGYYNVKIHSDHKIMHKIYIELFHLILEHIIIKYLKDINDENN